MKSTSSLKNIFSYLMIVSIFYHNENHKCWLNFDTTFYFNPHLLVTHTKWDKLSFLRKKRVVGKTHLNIVTPLKNAHPFWATRLPTKTVDWTPWLLQDFPCLKLIFPLLLPLPAKNGRYLTINKKAKKFLSSQKYINNDMTQANIVVNTDFIAI